MHAFAPLLAAWKSALTKARDYKASRFGRDARDGRRLLTGPYDWMYQGSSQKIVDDHFGFTGAGVDNMPVAPRAPAFRMQINKAAELVQLFEPVLYHANPHRFIEPRKPFLLDEETMRALAMLNPQLVQQIADLQAQGVAMNGYDRVAAKLKEAYLNATPNPLDLKYECRLAICEALICGASTLWPESYTPAGTNVKVVGSFYDSIDNLFIDPAAPKFSECKYIIRRRITTVADCAKKFGIDPKRLKGRMESPGSAAVADSGSQDAWLNRARESSLDMIVWYEVYSKAGLGAQMKQHLPERTQELLDLISGEYAYMAFATNVDFPLNCPPELMDVPADEQGMAMLRQRFEWPVPYWADGSWPCEMIRFHEIPNDPWPLSHLAPAMGELKFLNWFYSFIAGKVLITSRDFIAVKQAAIDAVEEAVRNGGDLTVIKLKGADGSIQDLVQFLQHPQINNDVFKAAAIVEANFEKRTGMSELLYGQSARQYRSAAEAEIKSDAVNVRPDDMANRVEDSMAQVARLEAIAARFTLRGADTAFMCGPVHAQLWEQFVVPSDPAKSLYETTVRIEAGSVRKPNRSRDAENIQSLIQQFGPLYSQMAMMGNPTGFNALMRAWAETRDVDPNPYYIPAFAPPPPQGQRPQLAA